MDESARIEDLEVKVAHLEKATQDLSDVLWQQQRQIDQLIEGLGQLVGRVEALVGTLPTDPPADEKPPHY